MTTGRHLNQAQCRQEDVSLPISVYDKEREILTLQYLTNILSNAGWGGGVGGRGMIAAPPHVGTQEGGSSSGWKVACWARSGLAPEHVTKWSLLVLREQRVEPHG